MLKKFAVAAKCCALVSGGGGCRFGGNVAAEDGGLWPPRGEGESEDAADDFPRPRERPRRR